MTFALIGINPSKYAVIMLETLYKFNLKPKYVIIEDDNYKNLSSSAYYIDTRQLPSSPQSNDNWFIDTNSPYSLTNSCKKYSIPFISVDQHNSTKTLDILKVFPVDILLITEGPIIKGPILYMPRYCVMNIHAAPLPQYRGNWTTRLSLYNDEPPTVSAHVVSPWIDQGAILGKMRFKINKGDSLEKIDHTAMKACAELASYCMIDIYENGFRAKPQLLWEGTEYRGRFTKNGLLPAMDEKLQEQLKQRLEREEYGFFEK